MQDEGVKKKNSNGRKPVATKGKRKKSQAIHRRMLSKREASLLDELEALLKNPRACEILANDWLHDGTLQVPSLELMRYFACRMLTGYGVKIKATMHDRNGFIDWLVKHLRSETEEGRVSSIPRTLRRLDCFKYLHTGKNCDPNLHEWLPLLWPYLYPETPEGDTDAVRVAAGERMIARGLIEAMMHRALFTMDYKRLESLAAAMKIIRQSKSMKPTVENRVMGEILRWLPYLEERLDRLPSRAELEAFIRERAAFMSDDDFAERRHPWAKAYKNLKYPSEKRTIRMDRDLIQKLARKSVELAG
jgi:hypothetical protein